MTENIGSLLKRAREELGYTLEDVAQETKIQKRYIADLEEENYDDMPGRIYEKGFLKTYVTLLGLDVEAVMDLYSRTRQEASEDEKMPENSEPKSGKSMLLFIGIIIGLIIVYVFYSNLMGKSKPELEKAIVENVQVEEALTEEKAETLAVETEEKVVSEEEKLEKTEEKIEEKAVVEVKKEPILKEKAVEASAEVEKKELILNVKGKSWVEVYVNGKKKFYNMAENRKIKVEAKKDEVIKIKVGDSSKVEVSYNGNNIGMLGSEGQVVKKTF